MNTIKPTKEEIVRIVAERNLQRVAEAAMEREYELRYRATCIKKAENYAWYVGDCRNAVVAQWIADKNHFIYIRHKFGNAFVEEINHFEDDNGYDIFYPARKV
jgi:hypothetical protein